MTSYTAWREVGHLRRAQDGVGATSGLAAPSRDVNAVEIELQMPQ